MEKKERKLGFKNRGTIKKENKRKNKTEKYSLFYWCESFVELSCSNMAVTLEFYSL